MAINFNPNLPPNDSLTPEEIISRISKRNGETRDLVEKAYLTGGVPVSAAENAAEHSSITKQTPQAKKARKDAATWYEAKNPTRVMRLDIAGEDSDD